MADKQISQLTEATTIGVTDLIPISQGGLAKKINGQNLIAQLATALDGHGGIKRIESVSQTATGNTYRIVYADDTTFNFVAPKGDNSYIHIRYATQNPAQGGTMQTTPADWIGIYADNTESASGDYTDYQWYKIKGEKGDKGDTGADAIPFTLELSYGVTNDLSVYPTVWRTDLSQVQIPAGYYLYLKTDYLDESRTVQYTSYLASHNGKNGDGTGSVTSIKFMNGEYYDTNGVVTLPFPKGTTTGQILKWDNENKEWAAGSAPDGGIQTVCNVGVTAGTKNIALTASNVGAVSKADDVLSLEQIQASSSLTGKVPEAQALMDALTLKSGESMSYTNLLCIGFISSSTTMVNLSFFCGRPYANGSLTVTSLTGGIRKDNAGYLTDGSVASNASNWLTGSNVKSVESYVQNGTVTVAITLKSAPSGVSNNSNMTGYMNISFTMQ